MASKRVAKFLSNFITQNQIAIPMTLRGIRPVKTAVITPPFVVTQLDGIRKELINAKTIAMIPAVLFSLKIFLNEKWATPKKRMKSMKRMKPCCTIGFFKIGTLNIQAIISTILLSGEIPVIPRAATSGRARAERGSRKRTRAILRNSTVPPFGIFSF